MISNELGLKETFTKIKDVLKIGIKTVKLKRFKISMTSTENYSKCIFE